MNKQALDQSVDFIKSWLQFRYEREEIPGFVVAVAHKGVILMNEAYGYANLENKTELTPQHIFRIASHSKTFTATALMQLQEQGKLRIDDYVIDYLPWLKDHKDKKWQRVTLRQLMSHGAGIIRDGLNADYWQLERSFPDQDELKNEILEADLVLDNNVKLKYSNFGYSLLGVVVESVSGKTYNDYVADHIVSPLDLKNTGPEYRPDIAGNMVTGYSRLERGRTRLPIAQIDTKSMASATGFYATAADLCTYFTAQLVGSSKLLSDESKKEMQRVQWHARIPRKDEHEDYGLGFELEYFKDHAIVGHSGGFPGHITKSVVDPKNELVVTVLINCLGGPVNAITKGIFNTIDYFQEHISTDALKYDLSKLEGHFASLWSTMQVVVTGDNVVTIYPDSWQPFSSPEKLEFINETTFKVNDANSFDSEGELVHFNLKDDKVETVVYNGTTMWPIEEWIKKQDARQLIG